MDTSGADPPSAQISSFSKSNHGQLQHQAEITKVLRVSKYPYCDFTAKSTRPSLQSNAIESNINVAYLP
jgi:hypothetical protein